MNKVSVLELFLPEDQSIEFSKHVAAIRNKIAQGDGLVTGTIFSQVLLSAHTAYQTNQISLAQYIDEIFKLAAVHHVAIGTLKASQETTNTKPTRSNNKGDSMKLKTIVTYALSATLAFTATSSFAGEVTDRIIHSKTFNVGSRESSIPYSEKTANGYKGYSQEICAIIHAEFDKQHKVTTTINYVPVDGTTRWPSVQSGNADA